MDGKKIIEEYAEWIKNNSFVRDVRDGKYCAITTPFMDRHNDHIDIYITKTDNGNYLLTDDGDTISDLMITGTFPNTPKRRQIIATTLNGFGVNTDGESIYVEVPHTGDLPKKKHAMIQAILAINDMYMMSQENTYSFFKEDVSTFFTAKDITFVPDVKIAGKTGYDHNIDFILPKTAKSPERLIKTINKATKDQVLAIVFAFSDISAIRLNKSEQIVMYNDEYGDISSDAEKALNQYEVKHIPWSKRNEFAKTLITI
ncbi:DUF1829 domain-containing protein [Candidatus Saccharibacteria bacterium]|nr:DUF1829 domain-containing protein [Candidatus Saccharibacteria bacterium]